MRSIACVKRTQVSMKSQKSSPRLVPLMVHMLNSQEMPYMLARSEIEILSLLQEARSLNLVHSTHKTNKP